MTNKTLLQQALDALEDVNNTDREYDILSLNLCKTINRSIEALRAAIAEPEHTTEPVAWMTEDGRVASNATKQTSMSNSSKLVFNIPLVKATCYTSKVNAIQQKPTPIYQYQMADGSWIDQVKDSYEHNVRYGNATVRIVYTEPHPTITQPEQKATKLPPAVNFDEFLDSRDFYELMQSYRHRSMDAAKEFNAVKYALRKAIAQPKEPSLSKINQLALQYCTSYVSPHYVTFSVERLQKLIQAITQP